MSTHIHSKSGDEIHAFPVCHTYKYKTGVYRVRWLGRLGIELPYLAAWICT